MKKTNPFHYISNRVAFIASVVFAFLLIQSLRKFALFVHGEADLWKPLAYLAASGIYMALIWFWIVAPYRRCERFVKRFLEGYIILDEEIFSLPLLVPSTRQQIETMDQIFKSPQMMDLNKRQAQYLALQNQINPHFLYNTLESIRGEALIAGLDSIADMTEALAKFFRYTITKVENLVSVEEELDNCATYFSIQQYRFGDRLRLHIECPPEDREEIMNCRIPKLTLQPILENSIIHGTEQKIGTSNLRISFEATGSRLIIRISDDGVGMDEETLAKLNGRLRRNGNNIVDHEEEKKGGIALANVNNRIHLIFGEEYGMHVYSILHKGTDVEITIPFTPNEPENKGMLS